MPSVHARSIVLHAQGQGRACSGGCRRAATASVLPACSIRLAGATRRARPHSPLLPPGDVLRLQHDLGWINWTTGGRGSCTEHGGIQGNTGSLYMILYNGVSGGEIGLSVTGSCHHPCGGQPPVLAACSRLRAGLRQRQPPPGGRGPHRPARSISQIYSCLEQTPALRSKQHVWLPWKPSHSYSNEDQAGADAVWEESEVAYSLQKSGEFPIFVYHTYGGVGRIDVGWLHLEELSVLSLSW